MKILQQINGDRRTGGVPLLVNAKEAGRLLGGIGQTKVYDPLRKRTTRMTMEVYSHATAAMQDHAVTALDEFYRHAGKKSESISGQISGQTAESGSTNQDVPTETLTG